MSEIEIRTKVDQLRTELIDVLMGFGARNPALPAQALMAGLGELLIQFSVSQVGPVMTDKFLDDLKEAVKHFGPAQH